jgi:hypothetical protein
VVGGICKGTFKVAGNASLMLRRVLPALGTLSVLFSPHPPPLLVFVLRSVYCQVVSRDVLGEFGVLLVARVCDGGHVDVAVRRVVVGAGAVVD